MSDQKECPDFSALAWTKTWTSKVGTIVQIQDGFGSFAFAEGLCFTSSRERAPIYIMGNPDPKTLEGRRSYAGSCLIKDFYHPRKQKIINPHHTSFYIDVIENGETVLSAQVELLTIGKTIDNITQITFVGTGRSVFIKKLEEQCVV